MKHLVIDKQGSISSLERDLLSVAYKHSVGSHRNAHRTLQAIGSKKNKYDEEDKAAIEEYRKKIQQQVETICVDLQVCRTSRGLHLYGLTLALTLST